MLTGTDRLSSSPELLSRLRGARVGLLAHPASVDRALVHVSRILRELEVKPAIIFGPEHGYGGEAQDMVGVTDARDLHGTPVKSLYGAAFEDLSPTAAHLAEIDVLVIDLQDVGARYYTFVWTAVLALRAAVASGVRVVVLDRPNPIGCDPGAIEGRSLDPRYRSFVGLEPIPIRHSATLGDLVAWQAEVTGVPREQAEIVAVEGLDRAAHATHWDRPFVMPSPNMPAYETALVYPGGCLLEGTNLSDGRGTTRPFEITGAPFLDGVRLSRGLHAIGLPGMRARPVTFKPTFHKHAGKVCGGVQIHVTDPHAFRPVATYLALITLAHHQSPGEFRFRTETYEFVDDIPAFDLLTGDAEAREMIIAGEAPADVARTIAEVSARDLDRMAQVTEAGRKRRV